MPSISLATLHLAAPQQVFDHIAAHLLTQNKRSIDDTDVCAYRGQGGLKCAAGCLIDDPEYDPHFENNIWSELIRCGCVPDHHAALIERLQGVHDLHPVEKWKGQLSRVAAEEGLSDDCVRNFPK